jgi:hypothetical protein
MSAGGISWRGLAPEQERFMAVTPSRREKRVTWTMVLRLIGGYVEPRWSRDRRPQPLRSRMGVRHMRTMLRREAVARLRMEGKSFRQIGRELGVSQVAAWKLWQQLVEDEIEKVFAERHGERLLAEAWEQVESGRATELNRLRDLVSAHLGPRTAARFLGGIAPGVLCRSTISEGS